MRLRHLLFLALLLAPASAFAQATPQSKIAFDQDASDLATANAFTYKHFDDGSAVGLPLTPVTCTGTASPFTCQAPFPAFTPGAQHTIAVSAANQAGESLPSTPLAFQFIAIPNPPKGLRIEP